MVVCFLVLHISSNSFATKILKLLRKPIWAKRSDISDHKPIKFIYCLWRTCTFYWTCKPLDSICPVNDAIHLVMSTQKLKGAISRLSLLIRTCFFFLVLKRNDRLKDWKCAYGLWNSSDQLGQMLSEYKTRQVV